MAYDSTNTGAEVDAAIAKVAARSGDLIDGSGNTNKVAKFSGANTITDSIITDSGSDVTVAGAVVADTFSVADGTASLPSITNTGDTNTGIYFPTENSIAFTAGAGATLTSTNTALTIAVPTTVESTAQASLTLQGGDTNSKNLIFKKASAQQGKITAVGDELKFYAGTSGTESLEITTTGVVIPSDNRVGIGTTSPQGPLHVVDGTATGQTASGNGHGIILDSTTDPMGMSFLAANTAKTSIFFGDTDSNASGRIEYDHNGDNLIFNSSANTIFFEGSTERLRIDSGGNVGIGTNNPSYLLDVRPTNNGGEIARFKSDTTNAAADVLIVDQDNSNIRAALQVQGNAGSTECLFVGSNGNVGIGTASPSKSLVVNENDSECVIVVTSSDSGTAGIYFGDQSDEIIGGVVYDNSTDKLQLRSSNNNTAVTIDSSERVGIGTESPNSILHLSSSGPTILTIEADTDDAVETDNARIVFKQDGGAVVGRVGYANNTNSLEIINEYPENLFLGTNNGTDLTIDSAGNVGIGTESPSNTLHVENTTSSGAYINYDGQSNTEFGLRIESNADGGYFESDFGTGGTALLDLYANSAVVSGGDLLVARTQSATPVLLVKGNGNVGIGTSPFHKLDVTGTGRFSTGVTFGSDTADANKLDDYEEGTWTPTISFGGGSTGVTYSYQVGTFTKIGDLVTASCYMALSSKGSSTGAAVLKGLPVASRNLLANLVPATLRLSNISFADFPMGWNQASSTDITLQETTNAGITTNLTDANFSDISEVMISISYRV